LGSNNGEETTPYGKYGGNVSCSRETPHKGQIENVDHSVLGAWIGNLQSNCNLRLEILFGVVVGLDELI
jgi:hypothetical protein